MYVTSSLFSQSNRRSEFEYQSEAARYERRRSHDDIAAWFWVSSHDGEDYERIERLAHATIKPVLRLVMFSMTGFP